MPVFVAMLLTGLVQAAASMAGRVLIALGVGFATYTGVDALVTSVQSDVWSALGSVSGTVQGVFGLLRLGACVNVLLSAYTIRLTLAGLQSGAVKRWVLK